MIQKLPVRIAVALMLFALAACANATSTRPAQAADESFEIVKTDEFEGVIVSGAKARSFMKDFSGLEEKEVWTPARTDVLKLEENVEEYLKQAAAKRSPNLWSKLKTYKRQYVGIVRGGRKVIYANFFCESYDTDWKTTAISVEDGGDCYFNVLYDPEANAFSKLYINGDA